MPFHLLRDDSSNHEFASFIPDNFESLTDPPIIVFLHGSGERGNDPGLALKDNAHVFENLQLPAAVIFPKCEDVYRAYYGEMEYRVMQSIEIAKREFETNTDRIFLIGYSMGGSSNFWLVAKHPQIFRAMICIAPGITWMGEEPPPMLPDHDEELFNTMFVTENRSENIAKQISDIPTWFLQGTEDKPCSIGEARSLVNALRGIGAQPVVTEYDGVGHDCLSMALEHEGLFNWLLSL